MNTLRFFRTFGPLVMVGLLSATANAQTETIDITILSGSQWLTNDVFESGWETVNHPDSEWDAARSPYPNQPDPSTLIPGTLANPIWHDPTLASDGSNGSVEAYFRFKITLDLISGNAPVDATAQINVDDDYELYVNGTLVLENHDGGFGNLVDTVEFGQHLRHGDNVIAIHAVDGSWDNPRERGLERLLFDATLKTALREYIPIRSDDQWLTSDTEEANWQALNFPDMGWDPARAPYPNPTSAQTLITDTLAQFIWHDPTNASDGTSGADRIFLRRSFFLDTDPETAPAVGQMLVNADDDYDVYVNGYLVFENHDEGFSDKVDFIDFTYALREGFNVIAIEAVDGGWSNPRDRGAERVLVDGVVATGVLDWTIEPIAEVCIFGCVDPPALEGDRLAIVPTRPWNADTRSPGVYLIDVETGAIDKIVQDGATLPDATGVFGFFDSLVSGSPSLDDGDVAFTAEGIDPMTLDVVQSGVYKAADGLVTAVATTNTPIPAGTGTFGALAPLGPSLSAGHVVFFGEAGEFPNLQAGVYSDVGGTLQAVADRNTLVPLPPPNTPGSFGTFNSFGVGPSLDGDALAFWATGINPGDSSLHHGIYLYDDATGAFEIVADEFTQAPGSSTDFEDFLSPAFADGQVAFLGETNNVAGIYAWREGVLRAVSDPSAGAVYGSFPATDAGNVAYLVLTAPNGALNVLTDLGDVTSAVTEDDELIPAIDSEPGVWTDLRLYHEGMSGNRIAFLGTFNYSLTFWEGVLVARDDFRFVGDADGDGIADVADNCIERRNPGQSDTNGDGYGNACDPDVDDNGTVDFLDLGLLKSVFFQSNTTMDFNGDGFVDFLDLGVMKALFFGPPGPSALAP